MPNEHKDSPLNNSLSASIGFIYPEDSVPEIDDEITRRASELSKQTTRSFVLRLAVYILDADDPKLDMIAVCYLCGIPVSKILNCEADTITAIARSVGIARQVLYRRFKRVASKLGLPWVTCNAGHKRKGNYDNNATHQNTTRID